jgi:hypothetical protein
VALSRFQRLAVPLANVLMATGSRFALREIFLVTNRQQVLDVALSRFQRLAVPLANVLMATGSRFALKFENSVIINDVQI